MATTPPPAGNDDVSLKLWLTVIPGYEKLAKSELESIASQDQRVASSPGQVRFALTLNTSGIAGVAQRLARLQEVGGERVYLMLATCSLSRLPRDSSEGCLECHQLGEASANWRLKLIQRSCEGCDPQVLRAAVALWRQSATGRTATGPLRFRVIGKRGGKNHGFSSDDVKRAAASGLIKSAAACACSMVPSLRDPQVILRAQVHCKTFVLGFPLTSTLNAHNAPTADLVKGMGSRGTDHAPTLSATLRERPVLPGLSRAPTLSDWVSPPAARCELRDCLTPLAEMEYTDQLLRKQAEAAQVLKRMARTVRRAFVRAAAPARPARTKARLGPDARISSVTPPLPPQPPKATFPGWLEPREGKLFVELDTLRHCGTESDAAWRRGWRNKCEMVVGVRRGITNAGGKESIALGFRADRRKRARQQSRRKNGGKTAHFAPVDVVSAEAGHLAGAVSCSALPREFSALAEVVGTAVRASTLPPYEAAAAGRAEGRGFWYGALMRGSRRTGNLTLVLRVRGAGLEDGNPAVAVAAWEKERAALLCALLALPAEAEICSMRLSSVAVCDLGMPGEVEVLWGREDAIIDEELAGLRFSVTPTAFFQVHTAAAEALVAVVRECVARRAFHGAFGHLPPPPSHGECAFRRPRLLDVCCGTGMLGLCVADLCEEIVGIETDAWAVADAARNAARNGFRATNYVCGRAENEIGGALASGDGYVCAIVDPARTGLKPSVCAELRARSDVRRVIYVSCNPHGLNMRWDFVVRGGSLIENAVVLCGPRGEGRPFRPAYACAVDLFPDTPHFELVVVFVREDGSGEL